MDESSHAYPLDKVTPHQRWALAYVGGRARSYRRGRQPLAAVVGSIAMARGRGVSDDAIVTTLQDSELSWDAVRGVVDMHAPTPTFER